jgi:ATP-dependent helicase/nuclease subunit B
VLTITCGPYHPHLEAALADDVIAVKTADPFAPVIIVVPSDALRRRIVRLLAGERGRTFLNLSVLTFHQLSRRLVEEATGRPIPVLADDHAFEELMRLLLDRGSAGQAFAGVAATRGGGAALWQTLRDLKDAKLPPRALAEAVTEGIFPADDASRLAALTGLYREVLSASEAAGWVDYTDLDATAAEAAPASVFLASQRLVAYYGFYDVTQAQYDVLRAVAGIAETAVYFPFASGDPAWAFADRLFTRYLTGLAMRPARILDGPAPPWRSVTLVSCSGVTDEVRACAKAIMQLVEDEGFAFDDIGVAARSLEAYADVIAREFARHHLPMVTTAPRSLARYPLAQAALRVTRIAEGKPTREDVIDVLASPWCRVDHLAPDVEPYPALWDELARSVGVVDGYEAWTRLDALVGPDGGAEPGASGRGAQAAALLRVVDGLRRACEALPDTASGAAHADAWRGLLAALLGIEREADAEDGSPDGADAVSASLIAAFDAPARLDVFAPTITRSSYLDIVRRRIESTTLSITDPRARGVQVMDAASARGVSFRALFVLGLNEGVFPRVIREDAFLRDRERRLIETTLGYKMPEKLAGHEEERLLFAALTQAARDRLVLSAQRADDAGRALAPSWYLAPWRDAASGAVRIDVPRRAREKPRVAPFDRVDRLTPREALVLAELLGAGSEAVADARTRVWLARATECRAVIDAWASALSAFDGDVRPPDEWLVDQRERGYAATGLSAYAACPWQFFMTRVLDVAPPADAEARAGPTAREWGVLAHEAVARAARDGTTDIDAVWREVCARHARRAGIGYPLAWELAVERIGRAVAEVAADDAAERARSGYQAIEIEIVLRGDAGADPAIPIQGRLDRLDQGADGRLRVIDWKFRTARAAGRRQDLVAAALRGRVLQPPIYEALAQRYAAARPGAAIGEFAAVFVYGVGLNARGAGIDRAPYAPDPSTAARILGTMRALVDGIEHGVFPMNPDAHCAWCEVAASCRRRHAPSRARAERDPRSADLDRIRHAPVRAPKEPG